MAERGSNMECKVRASAKIKRRCQGMGIQMLYSCLRLQHCGDKCSVRDFEVDGYSNLVANTVH